MVKFPAPLLLAAFVLVLPGPSEARTVKQVVVHETGKNVDPNDEGMTESCKIFKPTVAQVKRYFTRAYPVESYVLTTERYSPCYATGFVKFSDNSFGKFQLHSSGTATLFWNRGDSVNLLYKHNKWRDPLACNYGLGDEPEC